MKGWHLGTRLPGVRAGRGLRAVAPQPGKPCILAPDQAGGKGAPGPSVFTVLLTDMDWAAFLLLRLKGLWE